jgi:hypothetical protein
LLFSWNCQYHDSGALACEADRAEPDTQSIFSQSGDTCFSSGTRQRETRQEWVWSPSLRLEKFQYTYLCTKIYSYVLVCKWGHLACEDQGKDTDTDTDTDIHIQTETDTDTDT